MKRMVTVAKATSDRCYGKMRHVNGCHDDFSALFCQGSENNAGGEVFGTPGDRNFLVIG